MSIVLGQYGPHSFPFCLYYHSSYYYFCLDELSAIYFTKELPLVTKSPILKQLYNQKQSDFFKTRDGRTFIMTRTVLHIARLFNLYCLAELCKLSADEILGQVAEPLLNTIQCDNWQPTSPPCPITRDTALIPKPLKGNEWFFATPTSTTNTCLSQKQQTIQKNRIIYNKGDASMIHHWLTSSLHESFSPEIAQSIKSAAKVKRQQQAIIETRQRKMAFPIPNKKQKLVKGMLTIALDKKKSNMSIDSDNENNATTFPPSPPALANQYIPFPVKSNKKRSMASPQHDAKRTRIMPKDAPHDNLLLLATQATQMRDLPLSPAISPQSTVHPEQTQRLPSLKTMILELSHHTDQNMDSRA